MERIHRKIYLGLLLCVALTAFFIVFSVKPPFSSPDEGNHIARADSLLSGDFFLYQKDGSGNSGAEISNSFDVFAFSFGELMHSHNPAIAKEYIDKMKNLEWNNIRYFHSMPNVGFYFPLIYAPHAISMAIGKTIGLNVYHTYFLMNLTVFLLSLYIIYCSNRIIRLPFPFLIIISAPMAVFQLMSPTIDGLTIALSALLLSCFVRVMKNDEYENRKLALIMMFGIFIVATSRANMLPLVLLPGWIYLRSKNKFYLKSFLAISFACVAWTAFAVITTKNMDTTNHAGLTNAQVIVHYATHPFETAKILVDTWLDPVYVKSYYMGMFGAVAWQDAIVNQIFRIIALLAIPVSFALYIKKSSFNDTKTTVFMVAIALIIVLLTFLALLAQWSPFPTERVIGVQGRYLFIPLIMVAYSVYTDKGNFKGSFVVSVIMLITSVYFVHEAIINRFF